MEGSGSRLLRSALRDLNDGDVGSKTDPESSPLLKSTEGDSELFKESELRRTESTAAFVPLSKLMGMGVTGLSISMILQVKANVSSTIRQDWLALSTRPKQ